MPTAFASPASKRRLVPVAGLFVLSALSCGREPTAPHGADGIVFSQGLSWIAEFPAGTPAYQAAGGSGVAFTQVRVQIRNPPPDGPIVLDTLVQFPAGSSELQVTLSVPLPASAPASGAPMALSLAYQNAAGETVFRGGPVTVNLVPAVPGAAPPPPAPITIPVVYTGTGATATRVAITPPTATVPLGGSFGFTAQAFDAGGAAILGTPIVFSIDNPAIGTINTATGGGQAGNVRGSATVTARTLTGLTATAALTVIGVPTGIAAVSGSGQTGTVGQSLPNPIVVRVTAADNLPVAGASVSFSAAGGGSVGAATVTTDASGLASTSWRLGATVGTQTASASVGGGGSVSFSATAKAVEPVRLEFVSQPPATLQVGAAFGVAVRAVDATGTVATEFAGTVSLSGGGGLTGTTSATAVAGVATFSGLKFGSVGSFTLSATSGTLGGATSSGITVTAGAAAKLVFLAYPGSAVAGATLDVVSVAVQDIAGNPVPDFTGTISLSASGPAGGGLTGGASATAAAGVATFGSLSITVAGAYTLIASSAGLTSATGGSFTITPGPAKVLALASGGGQSGPGSALLPNPIVVKVSDTFGNGVGGVTVSFAPAVGSGTVSLTTAVSAGTGLAQTAWMIGGTAGPQILNVSGPALLPNPLVVTATATTTTAIARTWNGSASTAWTTASNWTPAGVPAASDPVTIPTGTLNAPTISSPVAIGSLTLVSPAILTNTSTLTVGGSLAAGTTIVGGGTVILNGPSGTLSGDIVGNLTVASNGTYTLNNTVSVTGNVTISSSTGQLHIGQYQLAMTGNLVTTGGGRLVMQHTDGEVIVQGNATFGSGATLGTLTAGMLTVERDFTASGTTFSASGTHILNWEGNQESTQTLTFTAPAAGQGIRHITFGGPDAKVMAGAPQITGNVLILDSSGPITGAVTVRIGGNLDDETSLFDGTGAWQVANTDFFGTTAFINADHISTNVTISGGTLEFVTVPLDICDGECLRLGGANLRSDARWNAGAARAAFGRRSTARSLLPAGVAHYVDPQWATVNGNVMVNGGSAVLRLKNTELYVYGDFATASGGTFRTDSVGNFLWIEGNATFAGGSTAGLLMQGGMQVIGNLTQGGGHAAAFAPSAAFTTYVGDYYYSGGGLRTALARAPRARQATALRVPANLRGPAALIASAEAGARQQTAQRAAFASAAAATGADRRAQREQRVAREWAEHATRRARIAAEAPPASARRTALRAPRVGLLRAPSGRIQLASVFSVSSTITFANPASSGFGNLYLSGEHYALGSDVNVLGMLETGGGYNFIFTSTTSATRVVTSRGADVYDLEFSNVRWVLLDGSPVYNLDYVDFSAMDPAVDQFTLTRSGDELTCTECTPAYTLYSWSFNTAPTTGNYVRATDTNGPSTPFNLDMQYPTPSTHAGRVVAVGGVTFLNWPQFFNWTGLGSTDSWHEGANWSTGIAPWISDNVTIPAGTPRNPYISVSYGAVRDLTVGAGKTISISCGYYLNVHGNLVTPLGAPAITSCEGDPVYLSGNANPFSTVVGNVDNMIVYGNYRISGPGSQLIVTETISIYGDLSVNGGRLDVGGVGGTGGGALFTLSTGTFGMTNPADLVFVGGAGAHFFGGSTAGKLTAGTMTLVNGSLVASEESSDPAAFAPSGTHSVVLSGTTANFAFVSPTTSFINNLTVPAGITVDLDSDVAVKGTLTRSTTGTATIRSGTGSNVKLKASGLNLPVSTSTTFTKVLIDFVEGTPNGIFNNATFSGYLDASSGALFRSARTSGGPFTFTGLNFSGAGFSPAAPNHFIEQAGSVNITLVSPSPTGGILGTHYTRPGTGSLTWP